MNVRFDLIFHPKLPPSFTFEKPFQIPDAEVLAEEFLVEFFADAELFSQDLFVFSGDFLRSYSNSFWRPLSY